MLYQKSFVRIEDYDRLKIDPFYCTHHVHQPLWLLPSIALASVKFFLFQSIKFTFLAQ